MLNISRTTLYRRMAQARIEPIKLNPALDKQPMYFKRQDVENLINSSSSSSAA